MTLPEYLPWYQPDTHLVRCSGDAGCGVLLVSGDVEFHDRWHEKVDGFSETR